MSIRESPIDKKDFYNRAYSLANAFLVFAVLVFLIYLTAPLVGGKLSVNALLHYGSWVVVALVGRMIAQRYRKGLKLRVHEYLLICLTAILNSAVWFSYPINVLFSIFCVAGIAIACRVEDKKGQKLVD